jgi:hypothetical protein
LDPESHCLSACISAGSKFAALLPKEPDTIVRDLFTFSARWATVRKALSLVIIQAERPEFIAKSAAQNKNIENCNHTLELQISFSWMLRSKYNGRQTHADSQGT